MFGRETTEHRDTNRFAVSDQGMQDLHSGREPWMLVKELIQNAWDEAPCATHCEVTVIANGDNTRITVADDGPGFAHLPDAWTLMGNTPKRADPLKRGRFNLGEKEVVAVAMDATIETVGYSVTFPPNGGRDVTANSQTRGTTVSVTMPWNQEQSENLVERLLQFRPTECALSVNGVAVPRREPLATGYPTLTTVVQPGPGAPMRNSRRKTEIHLLSPVRTGEAWLYEMGIPVQRIRSPYDVDVQQKVPVPPHRDTVADSYLRDIYTEILNAAHHMLEKDEFHKEWMKQALSNRRRVSKAAVDSAKRGRYGEKALLMSPNNPDANLHAIENGYQLIDPHSLSDREHKRIREAGTETAGEAFPHTMAPRNAPYEIPEETEDHIRFKSWVKSLADCCGLAAEILIIEAPKATTLADCTASTKNPTLRFNQSRLGEQFFSSPYGRPVQLSLVFHELGHARQDRLGHGPSWGQAVAEVASLIASRFAIGTNHEFSVLG